jgi:hypothetical protein
MMSSAASDLSRERVEFLLASQWPADVVGVDSWLSQAPVGRLTDPPADSGTTPVTVNAYEGRVAGFSWFAYFDDPARLIEAHETLASLITSLLGVPVEHEREGDHSGYWVTSRFAIETYAHDVSERGDGRQLKPTLQVNVADAALAAAQEAQARRNYGGHPPRGDVSSRGG